MSVLFPWLFWVLILVAAVVFLWPLRRTRTANKNEYENLSPPLFNEEFSEELNPPAALSSHQLQRPPEPELPHCYGIDRMVLLARDPHWLFAYWEITATKQDEFTNNYGPEAWSATHPVLRIYDITGIDFNGKNALGYTDIHISESADNWYVQVGKPDRSFCVDLGRMFPDGRFITLLRSNAVTTPRASLSDRLDEEWMWIEGLYRTIGKFQFGTSSPMIIEELAMRSAALPLGISSPGLNNDK
ncbi:MAG: hypothetical protein A4E52_01395 [Pelotomaculum sp. PtaB.Bin013]|uniref:DUF4912 domain-containing protein n=1 Tax=Pelotomaculum isophthalicicum JI TaxID=947010 RepID=A0A9X4JTL9_9FIRM|nr:DUF4912 domain-containing protein [Pelotomaculum isophthalicicum]MDF9408964.1 DUF4912 domain-containing protein [Pelotomaculum isophthalicicum JI]OPX87314.1 MAG: hypothetical protein A4E52_01395 [Pelotomaculum sp. PtaB.Bin013]